MDVNVVVLSGRVFDMGYSPLKDGSGGVAEGRLMVVQGKKNGEEIADEFGIRAYGKKADFVSGIRDGTMVTVQGTMREDLRVNTSQPDTVRSKVYVNVDTIKVMEVPK